MCRSMVDIQSPTAEIRREKKKKEEGKNMMSASAMQGGRNNSLCIQWIRYLLNKLIKNRMQYITAHNYIIHIS